MKEQTMQSLKVVARLKLAEADIDVGDCQFERFWDKFAGNVFIAFQNEITAECLDLFGKYRLTKRGDEPKSTGFSINALAAGAVLAWLIGLIQGSVFM